MEQWRPPPGSLRRAATHLTRGERWERVARISGLHGRAGDQGSGVSSGPNRLLERIIREHSVLLQRIPSVNDLQSAWYSSIAPQPRPPACCVCSHRPWCVGLLKITTKVCGSLCQLLGVPPHQSDLIRVSATAPLILGGLGLRSDVRTSDSVGPVEPIAFP